MPPELLLDGRAELGESPAWDAGNDCLYWVDIHAGLLHSFHSRNKTDTCVPLGEPVGCVAPCQNGDLITALRSSFATFHPSTHKLTRLVSPELNRPGNRFNDGKCDPAGRFIAGSMDDAEKEASGGLYSYSADGRLTTLLTGVRISNGLTWSPDYKTFYYIDTPSGEVKAYGYDLSRGELDHPRRVINVPRELGWPDGMTSDLEGMLWVAMWGGARLTRWNPATGELLEAIPFPALNITSCIFGGENLSDLYVTSARQGMAEGQLKKYPLSGGLFKVKTKVQGLPTFKFGG